tara:strand:- start:9 stop:611 length:603 start_codon:yes stop_codon:yes gene_type:complete
MINNNILYNQNLNNNIVVFLLFIFLFIVQWLLVNSFQNLNIKLAASLIYLPHGLRVLATLIGGTKILPGLFLGHLFTGLFLHYENGNLELIELINNNYKDLVIILLTSLGSTFSVIISMFFIKFRFIKIRNITLKNIITIAILSSIINSFLNNTIYFISYENWPISSQFIQYITGDLIGALIIFYLLKFINNFLYKRYNR